MSLKDLFDPTARAHLFQLWSNWLAVVFAAALAWIAEEPQVALSYTEALPQPWRSIVVFIITASIPIAIRAMRQPRLSRQIAAERGTPSP